MRFPDDARALPEYSTKLWRDLDGFYQFWVERWRATMDFIRSQHWNTLQKLDLERVPDWEEFPVVDLTASVYTDYLRQWLEAKVRFSAMPDSPDQKEVAAAELADHVLRYIWDQRINKLRPDIGAWLMATGNADVRVFWDTDTGDLVPLAIPGKDGKLVPVNPETLQPDPNMTEPIMVDAGELGVEVISPQLVRWPFQKSQGVMIGLLLSYEDAESRYGKAVAEDLNYQKSHTAIATDLLTVNVPGANQFAEERALVVEHQLPRSFKNPSGLWWTCSDRLLVTPPQPLPGGRISVVPFRWVPMPGHPVLGTTPLHGVRHANKIYEKPLKYTLEWQRKIKPKRLLPAGGGIKRGDITDEPGQELSFNPGAEPKYDIMPQPSDTFERVRQEAFDMLQTVALYKFRQPRELPPGESTRRARQPQHEIGQAQEVALAVMNSADSWVELGYVVLSFIARFYTEPKTISIVGPDRTYQWREFIGSDLANLRTTLRISEVSLYPWNKQSTRDAVIGLLDTTAGQIMFSDGAGGVDKGKIEAAFDAAGLEEGFRATDQDAVEARNEISEFRQFAEGSTAPEMKPWQNHEVHIQEKLRVVKSMSFRGWAEPAAKTLLDNISQHEQALKKQQDDSRQAMIDQESGLRQVRAIAESAKDVRSALGEALVEALMGVITGKDDTSKKKKE